MELKPCPFCGRRGSLFIETDEIGWVFVHCNPSDWGCGTTGPAAVDKEDAIEKWNKRVSEQQLAEYEEIGISPQDIKKQLSTYSSLLCEITHNKLSKTNYTLEAILSAIADGETE